MYGQDVTDFAELATLPGVGATLLQLTEAPTNWQVGDIIVVAGTRKWQSELRTILGIAGSTVSVDALTYERVSPAPDLKSHVAHRTRNVQILSENTGHMMVMHTHDAQIHNAGFYDLGRTDKQSALDNAVVMGDGTVMPYSGTNQRARYSVHVHRAGPTDPNGPAVVTGSVVSGNPGWGYVNHSSNVDFTDNVAYDVSGAGFASEVGDEIGVFTNNIAIAITGNGDSPRDGKGEQNWGVQGDGFWFQGYGVDFFDNVAADLEGSGYATWTDPLQEPGIGEGRFPTELLKDPSIANGASTVHVGSPSLDFDGNTTYAAQRGAYTWHLTSGDPRIPTVWKNLTAWQIHKDGMKFDYSSDATLNLRLFRIIGSVGKNGIAIRNHGPHDHTNPEIRGFNIGIRAGLAGENTITGGILQNKSNLQVDIAGDNRRVTVIGTQFLKLPGYENDTRHVITGKGPGQAKFNSDGTVRAPEDADSITFDDGFGNTARVWDTIQARDAIPYPEPGEDPNSRSGNDVPSEYVGLTNQQLWDQFGVASLGELAPVEATAHLEVDGLVADPLPYFLTGGPVGGPVNDPPVASFTSSATGLSVDFTDTSTDDGAIASWSWDFGDGNSSTAQNPTHVYAADGAYTVTLTATDDAGASDSASATVTVSDPTDTTPPTITAPADVSVEATGETTPVALGSPTVSDNEDPSPAVSHDAPMAFPVGATVVTWTATDASGNSASDTQTVTVVDTIAPSITAPADITVEATGETTPVALGAPSVSDIADPDPTVTNDAPATFAVGETVVTWTAEDDASNTASDTQTVTVTEIGGSPKLFRDVVFDVGADWMTIDLGQPYDSPVVIATPIYPASGAVPHPIRPQIIKAQCMDLSWAGPGEAVAVPIGVLESMARGKRLKVPGAYFFDLDDSLVGSLDIDEGDASQIEEEWQAVLLEIQRAEVAYLEVQDNEDQSVTLRRDPLPDSRGDLRDQFSDYVRTLLGDDRGNSLLALKGGDQLLGASDEPTYYTFWVEEVGAERFRYRVEETQGDHRKVWIADAIPDDLRYLTDAASLIHRLHDPMDEPAEK
jgi:PKD repeat protein